MVYKLSIQSERIIHAELEKIRLSVNQMCLAMNVYKIAVM